MKNNKKIIIIIGIIVLLIIGVIIAVNMKREEPSDDYIAVFHGGVGEVTHQTYIYKNGDGFKYVNKRCTTIRCLCYLFFKKCIPFIRSCALS